MKKSLIVLSTLLLTLAVQAQTMNVVVGDVTYQFPAAQAGDMTYTDGSTLTVMNKAFSVDDISEINIEDCDVTDNTVQISYNGSTASVIVAGNIAQYIEPTVTGAHVVLVQSSDVSDDTCGEITYTLSGTSTDGEFYLAGSYKATVAFNGLTLTNPNGAAVNIQNGKRIEISSKSGTVNTLTDSSDGSQKACLIVKGHAEFKGKGTLNIYGNTNHGIKAGEYISVKNCTINILSAVGDGINCNEYFLMESGTVNISGVGDDGMQVDIDGTTATAASDDEHSDEDTGSIYINDGTLSVTGDATAAKCVKSAGNIEIAGGTITLNANGDIDLTDTSDPSYTSGFKADGDFTQSGGDITINVTGGAGRGIAVDGTITTTAANTGTLTITNNGATYSAQKTSSTSAYHCTANGMKAGVVALNGGTVTVTVSGAAAKGIKADSDDGSGNLTITGGTIKVTTSGAGSYDYTESDAKGCAGLKSDAAMTISGGTITLKSTGTGGKCIKADGTLTISDGTLSATSSGSNYSYSSYSAAAKAIKADGALSISGGTITAIASKHEAIESKSTITISGGTTYAQSSDDAINSASTFTISGGYVMGYSTGNDGLDANGNMYIKGGTVYAICSGTPEVALDANTESGYKLYIQGGTIVAIGGIENGSSISQTCYSSSSWSKNTWYALYNGSDLALVFKAPSSGGSGMVVSTSGTTTLKSGVSISGGTSMWNSMGYIDATVSGGNSVSLSSYSGGNSGGGPGGGGSWGGGGRW